MYVSPTFSCLGVAIALKAINVRNDIERQGMGKDLWLRWETESFWPFSVKSTCHAHMMSCTDVMHMSAFHELFVIMNCLSRYRLPRLFHGSWASLTKSLPSSAKRVPSSNSVMPCAPAPLAACNSRASFTMLLLLFSEELCFFWIFSSLFCPFFV